jgi:hypothetical protein
LPLHLASAAFRISSSIDTEVFVFVRPGGLPAPGRAPPLFDFSPTFFIDSENDLGHTFFIRQSLPEMKTDIATTSITPLLRLLQVFDAESLGEGNLVAGANVLTAMCASLANLSAPGTCLVTSEGNRLQVGMSFMTAGGLTSSLVSEKVLDPIGIIQNNLGDHLAADAAHSAAKLAAMAPQEQARARPKAPEDCSSVEKLRMDLDPNGISPARDSSPFQCLLGPSRHQELGELAATPAVFLSADSVAGLEKQLPQSHRRYPFIRAVLADGPGAERLECMLRSVVRGASLPTGVTGPTHIRGHVAVSCTAAKLARSIEAGDESLLGNLLWLLDGNGCPLSPEGCAGDTPVPYKTHLNYAAALQKVWAERLDYRRTDPLAIQYDWEPRQREWVAFLRKLEPQCPGLTLAVRPLFGTLIFGLLKLSVGQKGEPQRWTDTGALALAKFLVGRMVQCREQLAQTERDARVLELAIKIVPKLDAGPLRDSVKINSSFLEAFRQPLTMIS